MKYEVTIIVKVDDEFKSRSVVVDDDIVRLNSQLEFVIESIRRELEGRML